MNTALEQLDDHSRVWIYQSNKELTDIEAEQIRTLLADFTEQWTSHNRMLKAYSNIYYNRFLVMMVDETQADASGCSIDKSVHFIQYLEKRFGIHLLDRMLFTWKQGEKIKIAPKDEFSDLYQDGQISDDTLVFDNLVSEKWQFEKSWIKPLKESWHKRLV